MKEKEIQCIKQKLLNLTVEEVEKGKRKRTLLLVQT